MDELIRVLLLKDGRIIVTKIEEVPNHEIGEPDCVMIDPVIYNNTISTLPEALSRFPGANITSDTQMAILSDNILTMVTLTDPLDSLVESYLENNNG